MSQNPQLLYRNKYSFKALLQLCLLKMIYGNN